MNVGRAILTWTARHVLALFLIILILLAVRLAAPPAKAWLQEQVRAARTLPAERSALAGAEKRFKAYAAARKAEAGRQGDSLRRAPEALLRQRRAAIAPALSREQPAILTGTQLALAAASGDGEGIFAHYRARAETDLLRREMRLIDSLLSARAGEREAGNIAEQRAEAVKELHASRLRRQEAAGKVRILQRRPLASARNFLCKNAELGVGCRNYRALAAATAEMKAAEAQHEVLRRRIMLLDAKSQALTSGRAAVEEAGSLLDRQSAEIGSQLQRAENAARANWVVWIGRPILEVLPAALAILALAILAPVVVKAFLYFLVAPMAARRPPLRLLPSDRGEAELAGAGPAASVAVPLSPGEELLVVPEAVQSTPELAEKRTKWLLSWAMPLSSLASGMVALVRIRPQVADSVMVSASDNGLAEVALIRIPEGSSIVVRPRALRGLLQPVAQPARMSRHWRLGHLSAWLTFQFRFLAIHGPCTLIIEGTRGVRLEPAGSGRAINQAATLGFSAGVAYSVPRSETFGAYLLGKQDLFNDSFTGTGSYLYEEVPGAGRRGGIWGRGLRGLGDAALKMFGL